MKSLLLCITAICIAAAPAGAQMTAPAGPSDVGNLHYYVGSWSCTVTDTGQKPMHADATYTLDSGLLREFVTAPVTDGMKYPYTLQMAERYDAKNHRFVETGLGNDGYWWVSDSKPWSGATESWTDHATNDNKLGRGETTRDSANQFSFMNWDKVSGGKVIFKGTCTRASAS